MVETDLFEAGGALAWLLGCTIAGLIIDLAVNRLLAGRAAKRGFRTASKVVESLHWLPTSLGVVVGAGMAAQRLELSASAYSTAKTGLQVVATLVIAAFAARAGGRLVGLLTARDDVPLPSGSIFVNLVRSVVWVLAGVSVLATLGISVAPLLTALGVGGLAVGLALQPTLENVFSGIQLITSGQIKPGDFIRLDSGDEGTVLDVTWRNTMVRKVTNDVLIVPNSIMARASVTNFSGGDPEFVLLIPVSFASSQDPDRVARISLDVANEVIAACPEASPDQSPGASLASLVPPTTVLNVTIRCRSYTERIPVRHEFIRRLSKRFAEEGVEAPQMLGGLRP